MDTMSYFATQSPITDPGEYRDLLSGLPKTVPEICGVIQGLCQDYAVWYTYPVGTERILQTNSRSVSAILKQIRGMTRNVVPLTETRAVDTRFYASSSDYAALFCSIARDQGTAARKRVGYVLTDGVYCSYDVAEYWNGSAWQQVDPAGKLQGEFLPAAKAWQAWRKGEKKAEQFKGDSLKGADSLLANLMLDLAAMNKVELLNWDRYGWMRRPFDDFSEKAWAVLDQVAELLLAGDEKFEELQTVYAQQEGLQVPGVIWCENPLLPPHKAELAL